ncbi:MAG: putrescine aminotransferase, partial [Paracoccaceae bacterium]
SPPLVITKAEIDTLMERCVMALDKTLAQMKAEGKFKTG